MEQPSRTTTAEDDGPSLSPAMTQELLSLSGPVVETLNEVPRIAHWALPLIAVLTQGDQASTLSPRERRLLLLRSAATGGPGPWLAYQRSRSGVLSEDEVEAGQCGCATWRTFSKREALVIQWAAMVTVNEAKREQATFLELREHFSDAEIVEMTGAVGMSAFLDRFLRSAVDTKTVEALTLNRDGSKPMAADEMRRWAEFTDRALTNNLSEV